MASEFQGSRSDQTGFSLKDFLFKYLRFLPLFILSLVLSLTIAFFYLRYTSPTFQARGALILTEDKAGTSNDKFDKLFVDDRSKNINNELEYLRSRALMERVVDALGINKQYYAKGKIKQMNIYKDAPFDLEILQVKDSTRSIELDIVFADAIHFSVGKDRHKKYNVGQPFTTEMGTFRLDLKGRPVAGGQYLVRWTPASSYANALTAGITAINKSGSSGIILLTMETDNPRLAADIINELMRQYQISTIEDKNTKTRQTLDFLNGRLRIVNRELDSITNMISDFKRRNNLTDIQTLATKYYSASEKTEQELANVKLQLDVISMIDEYLRQPKKLYETVPSSLGLTDVTLNSLIGNYNILQAERKKLIFENNVPAGNPRVKEKEDQIEKTRVNILETLRNVRSAYEANAQDLRSKDVSTQHELSGLPLKEQMVHEMERGQQSKLDLFKFLNEKKEETSISLAATISNTRVLDIAEVNETPVRPTSAKVRGIALLIGLLIPLIFVLILEVMDDKITTRTDIEAHTSATVIGEIGHAGEESTLVVKARSRSFVAEQFRIVRSNLQYVLTDLPAEGRAPVLLITSSFSGEGKSFISTNIGAVMALAGKRTIICEFDVRKPKILSGLNMTKKPGITNYILGKSTIDELLVPVEGIDNLWVLPCGPIPPNPAELLLDSRLDELFEYLKTAYDFLVIDTAPVGMVGDAMTLARFVDTTLYIVRQGVTHKKQLDMVNDFYLGGKLKKLNIILNDVKLRAGYGYYGYGRYGYGYGYGGSYGYGYGYGYGYYDDDVEGTSFMRRWFGWAMPSRSKKRKKNQTQKAG